LIMANERMQSEIYKLLTPEQGHMLDDVKRSRESPSIASK